MGYEVIKSSIVKLDIESSVLNVSIGISLTKRGITVSPVIKVIL